MVPWIPRMRYVALGGALLAFGLFLLTFARTLSGGALWGGALGAAAFTFGGVWLHCRTRRAIYRRVGLRW